MQEQQADNASNKRRESPLPKQIKKSSRERLTRTGEKNQFYCWRSSRSYCFLKLKKKLETLFGG
jgi:hypothetical protein